MLKDLRELFSLLSRDQRLRLLRLQGLIIIMSFAEIASVVSIGPFMAVVGDMQRLEGEGRMAWAYQATGLQSPEAFLTLLGIMVLVILFLSAMFSMYTTWRLSLYSASVGAELSSRLYRFYLHQPWLFHSGQSSSRLISKASQEVQRTTNKVIAPSLQLNAKLVMVCTMTLAIFLYQPVVAMAGALIFAAAYLLLYKTVRRFLVANGRRITRAQAKRIKLMTEGFGGIKDLLLLHRQGTYVSRFEKASNSVARGQGITQGLSDAPRYAIELVAFASIVLLVLYLLNRYEGNLGAILPALSIYALAGFKMLPAFQKIYWAISLIRGNLASYYSIRNDLVASREVPVSRETVDAGSEEMELPLTPGQAIVLQDVTFAYPGKKDRALNGLTLTIPANHMIGLVGASGSGKSTAVDILLGLIQPDKGEVLIDGVPLGPENLLRWQAGLGLVPQQIFLADASILENVALGVAPELIDEAKALEALRMAQLDELIEKLPEGIQTWVGERGVQLSGGQRQRIGIARALYQQAKVLVLDEATSALDGITERRVMEDIQRLAGNLTIVLIAHRLTTVKGCDMIYVLEAGQVVDSGTYEQLAEYNDTFKLMANL
ncbi:ABC transporter ATP-binding protein [Halomonas alkalicola]|uniref:ABC transporter ATP-binding protein n=1 Tax=Halomonas alkalicola TaxID=1930622 RepID=UPI00265D95EA|nr:ABC transporter ATP-binding protein [Halomonas alkalicola]